MSGLIITVPYFGTLHTIKATVFGLAITQYSTIGVMGIVITQESNAYTDSGSPAKFCWASA